MFTKLQLAD